MKEKEYPKNEKYPMNRREFLKLVIMGAAAAVLAQSKIVGLTRAQEIPKAKYRIVGDPKICVGCRRCEMVCSLVHEGKISPSLGRIHVIKEQLTNLYSSTMCQQCVVPQCLIHCPVQAISVKPEFDYARVIDTAKCIGCRTCNMVCPFGAAGFNEEKGKATKCDLCGGDPQCVKECPTGSLRMEYY